MGSDLSALSVLNMAVDMLDDEPLSSPTDDNKVGRLLRRWFPLTRDQLLRKHPWKFAAVRASLAVDPTAPPFGFAYRYALPAGYLRAYSIQSDGVFEGRDIPYTIENDGTDKLFIYTDQSAPLYLKFIRRVVDVNIWDPLFCMAVAARCARMSAVNITGKTSYLDRLMKIEKDALEEALIADSIEGTPERPAGDDWDLTRSLPAGSSL